jgi:trk system potassium uptake protein TrkA
MNVLVLGCTSIGTQLVRQLELAGHDISLIASDERQLKGLDQFEGYAFSGTAFTGDVTDPDMLRRAGVENCDAVAAVTDDDSDNLMAAQIARQVFGRKQVFCLVSDPGLERLYREKLGIDTLCPAMLTVNEVAGRLGKL